MFLAFSLIITSIIAYFVGDNKIKGRLGEYLLLIFILIDICLLIVYIPLFFYGTVQYLKNMASKLDAVILVALITGAISLLNSFYSRYSDNKNKRREYLSAKREEPYTDFIEMVYKITQKGEDGFEYTDEEMAKDIRNFNSKLTLWGSPNVVKKWNSFRKNSIDLNKQTEPEKTLILMEEVMNEMRKDLGVKSVDKGNLLSFFINDIEEIIKK